jgi:hypothetical protein
MRGAPKKGAVVLAFGTFLPPPYRVTQKANSVYLNRTRIFPPQAPTRQRPVRRAKPPDGKERIRRLVAEQYPKWATLNGTEYADERLRMALDEVRKTEPVLVSYELGAGDVVTLIFNDETKENLLLPIPERVATGDALLLATALAERARAAIAEQCLVVLGSGYFIAMPRDTLPVPMDELVSEARKKASASQRERTILTLLRRLPST